MLREMYWTNLFRDQAPADGAEVLAKLVLVSGADDDRRANAGSSAAKKAWSVPAHLPC
jgi:hypothetical protein